MTKETKSSSAALATVPCKRCGGSEIIGGWIIGVYGERIGRSSIALCPECVGESA